MHGTLARLPASNRGVHSRSAGWVGLVLLILAVVVGFGFASSRALGADAPTGQVVFTTNAADAAQMATYCSGPSAAGNLVLVFMVRGSGEDYVAGRFDARGTNHLVKIYLPHLSANLRARGYRVYAREGIYPALGVDAIAPWGLFGHGLIADYINSAWGSGTSLANQVATSISHCPQRRIVIAGYSQGGVAIRAMLHTLASTHPGYLASIAHVDLIADGSADTKLDTHMPRGGISGVDPRRATNAIWTKANALKPVLRLIHLPGIKAFPRSLVALPTSVRPVTYQYCLVDDAVCDTGGMLAQVGGSVHACALRPWTCAADAVAIVAHVKADAAKHSTYNWGGIGAYTGKLFPTRPTPPPPPVTIAARHISNYTTTPDLACTLQTQEDTADEFYNGLGSSSNDACGTFLVVDGILYAPGLVPAGGNLGAPTPWTPVAQQTTGTGTAADPYVGETTVAAGSTGIQLDQTDRWVFGGSTIDSTFTLTSTAGDARAVQLYRAADCYVGNSDVGTGTYDAATNSPGCLRVQSDGTIVDELLLPLTPGATSVEDYYASVWSDVAAQGPLPNSCQCSASIDNGFATSWLLDLNGSNPVTAASRFSFAQPSP